VEARPKIRVVLVEDEPLYRDLLRAVLAQQWRLDVVGTFPDGPSALAAVPALRPDVALLDIELPGRPDGIQLGLALRRQLPALGIVVLSNHADVRFAAALPREVISGWSYLLKKSVGDVGALSRAIEGAAEGVVVLDPHLVESLRPRAGSLLERLTPRQREILGLLAQGLTNAGIAERLVLAEKSVENHLTVLYEQLGIDRREETVHPRVQAVLLYLQESRLRPAGTMPRVG
jgi:DNA-binding NarL/FixJ family response regulator